MLPLQFHPVLKRIRWGGRRLGTVLGKPIGDANDYAESWEIADCGADQSTVAEGPFEGWTVSRLVAAEPTALFGSDRGPSHFPLLIKFLDCNDRLSVQVHPNDEQARRIGRGENGKTEAWLILEARPDSRVYAGLKPGVDRRSLERHLDAGTVEECLHSFPARAGDCVFVPAGTVHCARRGNTLGRNTAIQQCDIPAVRLGPRRPGWKAARVASRRVARLHRLRTRPGQSGRPPRRRERVGTSRRARAIQVFRVAPPHVFAADCDRAKPEIQNLDSACRSRWTLRGRVSEAVALGNTLLVPAEAPSLTLSRRARQACWSSSKRATAISGGRCQRGAGSPRR